MNFFSLFYYFKLLLAVVVSFLGELKNLIEISGFAQWIQRGLTIIILLYIRYKINQNNKIQEITNKKQSNQDNKIKSIKYDKTLIDYINRRSLLNETGKDEDIIKTSLIIPVIFLIMCLFIFFVTIVQSHKTALICFAVIAFGYLIYLIFIYKGFNKYNRFKNNSKIFQFFNVLDSKCLINFCLI